MVKSLRCYRLLRCLPALLLLCSPASASQTVGGELSQWLHALGPDSRIAHEVSRFSHQQQSLPPEYGEQLSHHIRQQLIDETLHQAEQLLLGQSPLSGQQPTLTDISFPVPAIELPAQSQASQQAIEAFGQHFIRTEFIALIPGSEQAPQSALAAYTSPQHRKSLSSQLKATSTLDSLECNETRRIPLVLEPTLSCNQVRAIHLPGLSAQHAQVVLNPDSANYHPIYFKESLKLLVKVPEGLALYYINYTRATELGSLSQSAGRAGIARSLEKSLAILR